MSSLIQRIRKFWLPAFIVLGMLLLVYSGTLQRDVNGSAHDYMVDVGEIQVSLNIWGTIHYTGYPTFTILGALLTQLLRGLGFAPAAAASVVATLWTTLGLVVVYALIAHITDGDRKLAALTILVLGLVETFWIHSVVAEVYSFSLFLASAILFLSVKLVNRWSKRRWWLLVLLIGTSVQHHRILLLLVPSVLLLSAPVLLKNVSDWPKFSSKSLLLFVLPFMTYFYLPMRALQGSPWVYSRPDTWDGFWAEFSGREVTPDVLELPGDLGSWFSNLGFLVDNLTQQLPMVVLLAGVVGLIGLTWRRDRWLGLAYLMGAGAFVVFVIVFPSAVWAPAVLMPSVLLLMIGLAYLLHRFNLMWSRFQWMTLGFLLLFSFWLFRANLPFVQDLVNDSRGRQVIETLAPLQDVDLPCGRDVVALPWGGAFFAAGFGLYVTDELGGFELFPHSRDFRSVVLQEGKILTLAYNLGNWPLDWWTELLGEAHYSSAAPGIVMISKDVLYKDIPEQVGFDLGNGVRVRSANLVWKSKDKLWLTVYWEATRDIQVGHSVAVHLVSRDPPTDAQDVLLQADALHPVSGWYPIDLWAVGEVVRDDYILPVPPGTEPTALRVAMYRVDEDGSFVNTNWLSLALP